jgi:hypothetical protein
MPPIEGSKRFLASYVESLMLIKQVPNADLLKGKAVFVRRALPARHRCREDVRVELSGVLHRKVW